MGHVKRGSKGIALIDTPEIPEAQIYLMFPILKTENVKYAFGSSGKNTFPCFDMLEHRQHISGERGLPYQLEHVAAQLRVLNMNRMIYDILETFERR